MKTRLIYRTKHESGGNSRSYRALQGGAAVALAVLPIMALSVRPANAQSGTVASHLLDIPGLVGEGSGILGAVAAPTHPSDTPGSSCSEILRGNGTRLGYTLSHGNVIPETVSIHAAGRVLTANRDYWLDTTNGTFYLAEPVRPFESISVYYRFQPGGDAQRQAFSVPALQLSLGGTAKLGFLYGMSPGGGQGANTSTYGLALNSNLGSGGLGKYGGLFYFSHGQAGNNLVSSPGASGAKQSAADPTAGELDHLIVQNLGLQSGRIRANASFQDVGAKFNGFQTLKLNSASDQATLDQLTKLEGEKGIKRLGFGLGYALDPKSTIANGLSLDWNQIQDGKGAIAQEALGFNSSIFHANYNARRISSTFEKFSGLQDAEKTKWQQQKGMNASSLGFGFNFGGVPKSGLPGAFQFDQQSFGDKTGSLKREAWSLTAGALGLHMMNRRSDKGFTRLKDLSDEDKTTLALDLYRQYDPNAKAEQVTAADKAQIGHEAGLSRSGIRADFALGKKTTFAFSDTSVKSVETAANSKEPVAGNSLNRETLIIESPKIQIAYLQRQTSVGFTRIGDLADIDKNNLALDIRKQFDPAAKMEQVTQKDRDQMAKEAGLNRTGVLARLPLTHDSTLTLNQVGITAEPPKDAKSTSTAGITRTTLGFASKSFQFSLMRQSIEDRFDRLTDLCDIEKAQFANEHGLNHEAINFAWALNKKTSIRYTSLSILGGPDAVSAASAKETATNHSLGAAARAAASGMKRESLSLESQGITFTANTGQTDKAFARSGDLAMSDADKHAIEAERGFQRSDYKLDFNRIKGLILNSTYYNASAPDKTSGHETYRNNLQVTPNKTMAFSYVADADIATADSKANGTIHDQIDFSDNFAHGFLLNLFSDDQKTLSGGKQSQAIHSDFVHFETPKDKSNGLTMETKRTSIDTDGQAGQYEDSTSLSLHMTPVKTFSVNYSMQQVDRGETGSKASAQTTATPVKPNPSIATDAVDLQWQASKSFSVLAGVTQKASTDKKNADTVSVGLQGDPLKNVTVTAKFNEAHDNAMNTKDVADIAISNAKPIHFGFINNLTVTARYASLNDLRKLQNETMMGRASWSILKNEFLLDYGGLTKADGSTITRSGAPRSWW